MNERIIVTYKSESGFTGRYAQWIAKELDCACTEIDGFDFSGDFDTVIFGGGLYAGKVNGIRKFLKNYSKLTTKKTVVFTVGLDDANNEKTAEKIALSVSKQIPEKLRGKIKVFHFRGGMDYGKMSFAHKCMITFMKAVLSKKPESERTDSDKAVIENSGGRFDFSDKSAIEPLISCCKQPPEEL